MEGNPMFRECFMLHRTTKTVFAMDSFVEMGEANIPHPLLRAGSIMSGNFGRVSASYFVPLSGVLCFFFILCACTAVGRLLSVIRCRP